MNLLLDTTIQIDRITGSKQRKKAITEILQGHRLLCSTYVKGEFYSNIVNDLVTLFGLFLLDKDIGETGKRISERVFGRSQARMAKLYANILELCSYNVDEIEDTFSLYIDLIQDEFMIDIECLLDQTKCARAQRQVKYEDERPYLSSVHCTKNHKICEVCQLWKQSKEQIDKILQKHLVDDKILELLRQAEADESKYRGRNCMTLGDTVIVLEAVHCKELTGICSSNRKDFLPICESVGAKLAVPDYSWKKNDVAEDLLS